MVLEAEMSNTSGTRNSQAGMYIGPGRLRASGP